MNCKLCFFKMQSFNVQRVVFNKLLNWLYFVLLGKLSINVDWPNLRVTLTITQIMLQVITPIFLFWCLTTNGGSQARQVLGRDGATGSWTVFAEFVRLHGDVIDTRHQSGGNYTKHWGESDGGGKVVTIQRHHMHYLMIWRRISESCSGHVHEVSQSGYEDVLLLVRGRQAERLRGWRWWRGLRCRAAHWVILQDGFVLFTFLLINDISFPLMDGVNDRYIQTFTIKTP